MPKGIYIRTEAARANMAAASRRRLQANPVKHSEETKAKIAAAHRGKTVSAQTRAKISESLKGNVPTNKGKQRHDILKKVDRFRAGLPIFCKVHGEHTSWRLHSRNNVQCRLCAVERQRACYRKYPLRFLVKWAYKRGLEKWLECSITEADLAELLMQQGNCCALTGVSFDAENRPSLDRIKASVGYIKGNVQLVLHEINTMKSDLPQERFVQLCGMVATNNARKK